MSKIEKVVVIGSGVMGSAIAAQIANSKTHVVLLDLPSETGNDRSSIARTAKDKLLSTRPAPLSHFSNANYITVGNLDDNLEEISDADLVIEAIIEKLSIKHNLYEKISKYLADNNALLASNTSTLPLQDLVKGAPKSLRSRFYITHFFNPPRYMELLELVSPANEDKQSKANTTRLTNFIEQKLGKRVINCKDTPGFIANRIGCYFLELSVRKAIEEALKPVIIDKIAQKYFAFPSTGIFALYDLIGHDVMELISKSLTSSLQNSDPYNGIDLSNPTLKHLKDKGNIGKKSGAGFYKIDKISDSNGKTKKVTYQLGLTDMNYHDVSNAVFPNLPSTVEDFLQADNEYSRYFKYIMQAYFSYCVSLIPSVTDNISDIDDAMKLGYGMKLGPFELFAKMPKAIQESITINPKTQRLLTDSEKNTKTRSSENIISQNDSALLVEKKDGYFFLLQSKMGTLNADIFNALINAIDIAEKNKKNLYIGSNAAVFSAGADLNYFYEKISNKEFNDISALIKLGQRALMRLKYSTTNIVVAASGLALGGGAEIILHSRNKILHQNINAGLVEVSVGLIPGWGGTKEMFMCGILDHDTLLENISNIIFSRKATSAEYFNEQYHTNCAINMNLRLLFEEAVSMDKKPCLAKDLDKLQIHKINLQDLKTEPCKFDKLQLDLIDFFQEIINTQTYSEDELLRLEHDKFIELCKAPYSIERIARVLGR